MLIISNLKKIVWKKKLQSDYVPKSLNFILLTQEKPPSSNSFSYCVSMMRLAINKYIKIGYYFIFKINKSNQISIIDG